MLSNVKMTFACRFASLCIIIFRTPFIHKSFFYLQICKIKFLIMYRFLTGDVIYFLMSLCDAKGAEKCRAPSLQMI